MDVELIHKLDKDNLVRDMLSRRAEFIKKKFHDIMMLSTIVYYDDSLLIKGMKEAYKIDNNALEIKKAFAVTKSTRKQKRLIGVSAIKDGLI